MIPDEVIEQVRDAADVVTIIGESVELKRTGSDYRGPCPFHGGTHRNFAVIPKKGLYYCYVCHEAGDVFKYMMKRFGMDYPTAVREIARRAGIVIPERAERAGPDPREPLYQAAAVAHDWYGRQLRESTEAEAARVYLQGRDLSLDTAGELGLGFAPSGKGTGGKSFLEAMRELGIEEATLIEAGLAVKRDDGKVYPRFRGRLLFPIHDLRGRVVGFGGRLLGPGEPKYLNSPETPIFHKGGQLYNLHQAKQAIRKEEQVLLVEGYFDVLRLVLAGVEHVVAPLGTALTGDQASLLRRYAATAVLLYDADEAGLRATFRAGDELLRQGVRVRVATMPPGEDPDTLVRNGGAAALEPVLRDAVDLLERKLQLLERRGWLTDVEHRRGALDRRLPTIRAASDPITRELYLSLVADKVGVARAVLEQEVRAVEAKRGGRGGPPQGQPEPQGGDGRGDGRHHEHDRRGPQGPTRSPAPPKRPSPAEFEVMRLIVEAPEWAERARREIQPEWIEYRYFREIFSALRALERVDLDDWFASLSPQGQLVWQKLRERNAEMGLPEADSAYANSLHTLEARPQIRRYVELKRQVRGAGATPGASDLVAQMRVLADEIKARFPDEWRKRFLRKGGDSSD